MSRVVVTGAAPSRLPVRAARRQVTQRRERSIRVFDHDEDRELYLSLMREHADRQGVRFHAWSLMTNHVHLVAVPEREAPLARAIGEAHRLYTCAKNFRDGVRGYLFQGRFGSSVVDDQHLVRPRATSSSTPCRLVSWHSQKTTHGRARDCTWAGARLIRSTRTITSWS